MRESFQSQLARVFFHSFFRLLVLFVSVAEWACLAWVLMLIHPGWGSWWSHLMGVGAVHATNLFVIARRRAADGRPPGPIFRTYTAVAFTSLFCFFFLAVGGLVWVGAGAIVGQLHAVAIGIGAVSAVGATIPPEGFRWFVSCGMAGVALLFAYGYSFGQRAVRVRHRSLTVRGPQDLAEPLRVVHISDIHIGQNMLLAELERYVDLINQQAPDLICITGDIIDSPHADDERFVPVLGRLRARHGVIAILGNHDHYTGANRVTTALRKWTSFQLLRDDSLTLDLETGRLHVIGLDDRGRDWARGVLSDGRLAQLLMGAPQDAPVLLLTHRPDVFPQAAEHGVALTLAGHTHGGQLALPWFGGRRRNLADFITAFSRGLYEREGSLLYVNCGLGVTAQRIRLFTPREIAVFDLVPRPEPVG